MMPIRMVSVNICSNVLSDVWLGRHSHFYGTECKGNSVLQHMKCLYHFFGDVLVLTVVSKKGYLDVKNYAFLNND